MAPKARASWTWLPSCWAWSSATCRRWASTWPSALSTTRVGPQPGREALARNAVRGFGRRQCRGLLRGLPCQRGAQAELIGGVAQGIQQRGVVGLHRGVEVSGLDALLGAQAAPVEDRQVDGRADPDLAAAGVEEAVQAQRTEAGKGAEAHVGIELRTGGASVLQGRLDALARRPQIGAQAQAVGRNVLGAGGVSRRRGRHQPVECRLQLGQGLHGLAGEGGQGVAGLRNLPVQRLDLGTGLWQRPFALTQLDLGVQAGLHPLTDEAQRVLALGQGLLGYLPLGQQTGQLHVGQAHLGGEGLARHGGLGLCGTLHAQG